MRMRLTTSVLILGLALPAQAQVRLAFTPMPRQVPISRLEAPAVYDSANQRVAVFMGYDHNFNRYREVWEYTPAAQSWRNVTPLSGPQPAPRSGSTAAYDPVRQRAILFGGLDDARQHLGDTWEWDCNARTWLQVATGGTPGIDKPTPREGASLVYDPGGDRLLLFGGVDVNQFYKELWAFAPVSRTWTKLTTSESSGTGRILRPRAFQGLTVVQPGNRVFAFGGEGFDGNPLQVLAFEDLWELVGTTWTDRTPSGPLGSQHGACANSSLCPGIGAWRAFAFDPVGNRLVTQGGYPFDHSKTWAFGLGSSAWSVVTTVLGNASLATRDSHAMVWDSAGSRLVLYGGYLSDLWTLAGGGSTWTAPPALDPRTSTVPYAYPRQDRHAMTYDPFRARVLAVSGGAPEVWTLQPAGAVWSILRNFGPGQPDPISYPRERVDHALAYDTLRDRAILFGGRCKSIGVYQGNPNYPGAACGVSGTTYNDVWSFDPATNSWTKPVIAGGPPSARREHALVYDPANQEFVLFGGVDASGNPVADTTWTLTCNATHSNCTWAAGGSGPSARYGHAMAWEPATGRVVLFGGHDGVSPLADVWAWNGSTNSWSGVSPSGTPPSARLRAALGQADVVTPGLLLFGGRDAGGPRNDAWLLTGAGGGSPQWQSVIVTGYAPAPRENPEVVFLPGTNRQLVYSGFDASGLLPGDLLFGTLLAKGDMDRSGTTDLLLKGPLGPQPVVWTMDGVSRLAEANLTGSLAATEAVAGVDDFNLNGRNDLVVWNSATGGVNFWLMNSATGVASVAALGGGPLPSLDWRVAATADFSHDGQPDLLLRNVVTQKLAIWALLGTVKAGAYAPVPDQAVDANWEVVGALDYNANGNTDLLWYNPFSGKIVFWFLDYNAVRVTGQFANPANAGANNWKVLAAGDYGTTAGGLPGTRDIVWRNETSGRFVVWYMDNAGNRLVNGGTFTNPMEPSPSPTSWTIVGPR